jgi:hypothetical protein
MASVNGNVKVNPQVEKFENFKKIALSVAAEPRRNPYAFYQGYTHIQKPGGCFMAKTQ